MRPSKQILEQLYKSDKNSVSTIAKKLSYSEHKVNYWLAEYKIPKRSISESVYLYHNPQGDPFEIIKPHNSKDAFLFGLGIGLYWGEGTKSNKVSVRLGNTDPLLIKKFIQFLIINCRIRKEKLRFGLQIFSDMPPNKVLKFWLDQLDVPKTQFFKKIVVTPARSIGTYRQKTKYGVLTVYYGNKKLRDGLCQIIRNMQ